MTDLESGDTRTRADLLREIEQLKIENSCLQSQVHEYRLVYHHTPAGFVLLDRDLSLLSLNEHARVFARAPLHKLLGRKCYEAMFGLSTPCGNCPVQSAFATGKVHERLLRKEPGHLGGHRYMNQIAVPVLEDGVVSRVLEIVIDRTQTVILQEKLEKDFLTTLEALAQLIEIHDPQISGHSRAVRATAELLAREMGIKGQDLDDIAHAAILHDIGKIGVPSEILDKNGPLTQAEYEVQRHPGFGERALVAIERFAMAREYVLRHHERYDGTGYPGGLEGEEIPLGARILAVADTYAAMTADRSYRQALSPAAARQELERGSGSQFDPHVVEKFLVVLDREEMAAVTGRYTQGGENPASERVAGEDKDPSGQRPGAGG